MPPDLVSCLAAADAPLSEADLQAFADGQLDAPRAARVGAYLRGQPGEARRIAFYDRFNAQLRAAFAPVALPGSRARRPALARGWRAAAHALCRRCRREQTTIMDISDQLHEHVPRLRRYARALVSNRDFADDLVQDTLERALARRTQFQAGTDLRAWLFTIMHNLFVTQTRKAWARSVHVPVDDETDDAALSVPANDANRLAVRDLDYALQRLPADQREVVLLVGLEEMSYADVALALDIPIGTVMSRLSRGRERLRALMAGTQQEAKLKVVR